MKPAGSTMYVGSYFFNSFTLMCASNGLLDGPHELVNTILGQAPEGGGGINLRRLSVDDTQRVQRASLIRVPCGEGGVERPRSLAHLIHVLAAVAKRLMSACDELLQVVKRGFDVVHNLFALG